MATQARRRRGRQTEFIVAQWFRDNGWPTAEAVASALAGVDIKGMEGLSIEVKARAGFDPMAWIRQARKRRGLPIVVLRCNGVADPADYVAVMSLDDLTDLLKMRQLLLTHMATIEGTT
jgi:hypothetical protein